LSRIFISKTFPFYRNMKIAITGARGTIGTVLTSGLNKEKFQITPIDIPEVCTSNFVMLKKAVQGMETIIHLAWDTERENYKSNDISEVNETMTHNIYRVAHELGVKRVIMASSLHAHRFDLRDTDGKIRPYMLPTAPSSPYGASKIFMEMLGRYYAHSFGLEVICIRLGWVNPEDKPIKSSHSIPQQWFSHKDCISLVELCLLAPSIPNNFEIIYGVSKSKDQVFDYSNSVGYEPEVYTDL
jgi:uronate dehydrogenase